MGPMLKLLATPFSAKDREKINDKNIKLLTCQKNENQTGYLLTVNIFSNKSSSIYNGKIFLVTKDNITANTPIEVRCDCASFKYQFETLLHLNKMLYGLPLSNKMPKKNHTIFACKHIQGALNYILKIGTIENIQNRIRRF
jgi:hypothetical protein